MVDAPEVMCCVVCDVFYPNPPGPGARDEAASCTRIRTISYSGTTQEYKGTRAIEYTSTGRYWYRRGVDVIPEVSVVVVVDVFIPTLRGRGRGRGRTTTSG